MSELHRCHMDRTERTVRETLHIECDTNPNSAKIGVSRYEETIGRVVDDALVRYDCIAVIHTYRKVGVALHFWLVA